MWKSPRLGRVPKEGRGKTFDLVGQQLFDAVERVDPGVIQFVLKTLGKHGGYAKRTDLCGEDGLPLRFAIERRDQVEVRLTE